MLYKTILALDPSGNFNEGKGTTGYCIYNTTSDKHDIYCNSISSKNFSTQLQYWEEHTKLISDCAKKYKSLVVVIEDYILYKDKASTQINSAMETSRLLGILQFHCYKKRLPVVFQLASAVKHRWADEVLQHKRLIKKEKDSWYAGNYSIDRHAKDALRHAIHYDTFTNKEDALWKNKRTKTKVR